MCGSVALMGELHMFKNGVATTIHRDGSVSAAPVKRCDECLEHQPTIGGTSTYLAGDEILWICALCRTPK
jgi:hypothetical protein